LSECVDDPPHGGKKPPTIAPPQGGRLSPYSGFVSYCDPSLNEYAPTGAGWAHEIKADGYRAQVHVIDGKVVVSSRRRHDWTDQFGPIAQAAKHLNAWQAILDGEAVVLVSSGVADFHALRRELGGRNSDRVIYQAFDLLYLDGYDLRPAPYVERKAALKALLADVPAARSGLLQKAAAAPTKLKQTA